MKKNNRSRFNTILDDRTIYALRVEAAKQQTRASIMIDEMIKERYPKYFTGEKQPPENQP